MFVKVKHPAGLTCPPPPPQGKYLEEERLLGDYPLEGPTADLLFKYKQRIFKTLPPDADKQLARVNARPVLKRVMGATVQGVLGRLC